MGIIFMACLLIFPFGYLIFRKKENRSTKVLAIIFLIIAFALFLYCLLTSLVINYFQPLSLSILSSATLIAGFVILLSGAALQLLKKDGSMLSLMAAISLTAVSCSGIIWANTQGYQEFTNIYGEQKFIFSNGEDGYATFRIPSLYSLDCNILNDKQGFSLENDVLLAICEGRINASFDMGDIDMVYKVSADNGNTWSKLKVLFSYKDRVGKFGNPTVVLNSNTGNLNMLYLKSGEDNGNRYQTFACELKLNKNFDLEIIDNIDISLPIDESDKGTAVRSDTLMTGPGKGVQFDSGEFAGRLIMPCSNNGYAFVMYSDDNGKTWSRGGNAGTGNECEAAIVNGELIMVVRDNTNCSAFHGEQYQRLSYSKDGGISWYEKTADTILKSPICMSSVDNFNGDLIMSYPDDFFTRANLSVAVSKDMGKSFEKKLLYNGASGYSCITVDSFGNVYVLAEIGKVNYNEVLVFMRVKI